MLYLLWALMIAVGIVQLVCWIKILINIFKESVGLGILGIICSLFAFIYGWVKVSEYKAQKLMTVWTITIVISIILNIAIVTLASEQMIGIQFKEMENSLQNMPNM